VKKILILLLVLSFSFSLSACNRFGTSSSSSQEVGINLNVAEKDVTKTNRNTLSDELLALQEEMSDINFVDQATAFFWKVDEGEGVQNALVEGTRLKANDISPAADRTASFFQDQGFEVDDLNTSIDGDNWTRGYRKDSVICLVSGTIEGEVLNLIVSCAEL